jgi:outer membrane protein assembly factor BamB
VKLRLEADAAGASDKDALTLSCLPREWPYQAFDHGNRRAAVRTDLTPANAPSLRLLWDFPIEGNVSSTPTVDAKRVYATSWNGVLYALSRKKGKLLWSYDTGAAADGGIKGSATLTPDGRVVVGDADVKVHCLDARNGAPLWQRDLELLPQDHIWSAPTVVGRRVFVPVASDGDTPCTKGRVVALDLDTGEPLWTMRTAPDRVCEDDTTAGCTSETDCGGARCVGECTGDRSLACVDDVECGADGPCGDVLGGGVSAAPASDPTGETLYVASVGCYTGPRVGNADRIFRVRAADGEVEWAVPDFPGEAFGESRYSDYGFLNGPVLENGPTPTLLGASKDGKVYARDALTGAERWTTVVGDVTQAQGAFAGFGLFNGAPALAGGRLFTSLNAFGDGTPDPIVHTQALDSTTGENAWVASADIGPTWGSVSTGGGVVFVGTSNLSPLTATEFHAFDAADGTELQVFPLPGQTASGPSIAGDQVFIGYGLGLLGPVPGGVQAYEVR